MKKEKNPKKSDSGPVSGSENEINPSGSATLIV
jgi:hypothetical protein